MGQGMVSFSWASSLSTLIRKEYSVESILGQWVNWISELMDATYLAQKVEAPSEISTADGKQ